MTQCSITQAFLTSLHWCPRRQAIGVILWIFDNNDHIISRVHFHCSQLSTEWRYSAVGPMLATWTLISWVLFWTALSATACMWQCLWSYQYVIFTGSTHSFRYGVQKHCLHPAKLQDDFSLHFCFTLLFLYAMSFPVACYKSFVWRLGRPYVSISTCAACARLAPGYYTCWC